jgi:hypothetical protein
MPNLLEQHGARPQREPKFVPLFMDRAFTGLFTQRAALHDPSGIVSVKFYGGRPDSLWAGSNIELTNRLTLQRRPGLTAFSPMIYPTAPLRAFSFELINSAIQVIVDTGSTGNILFQEVASSSGNTAVYTYLSSVSASALNAFAGMIFKVTGFINVGNNGTFVCVASSSTTLTLVNLTASSEFAVSQPYIASAISSGAVYYDTQGSIQNKNLVLSSVANSTGTSAIYTGTITGGGSNAFAGLFFRVVGFTNPDDNGTFICTASTTTTLTLSNPLAVAETNTAAAVQSLLFGKSVGAGQTYFIAVAGVLYMGDSVDTNKYTPLNTNGLVWKWGISTPVNSPSVTVVQSAAAAVAWNANSWYSTMGVIVDAYGVAQQLISVNNDPVNNPNTTQYGLSGNGAPVFSTTTGGTVVDGTVTWTCRGPIGTWKPNFLFAGISGSDAAIVKPGMIYDPASGGFYGNSYATDGISGSNRPPFNGIIGDQHFDPGGGGTCNWVCYANGFGAQSATDTLRGKLLFTWQKNHAYVAWGATQQSSAIISPGGPLPALGDQYPANQVFYYQTSGGGTSSASAYNPFQAAKAAGLTTPDGQLNWMSLGSATWAASTAYSAWTAPNSPTFSVIKETTNTGGTLWVCTTGGNSGSTSPWATTATNLIVWVSNTVYQVGQKIVDSNGNIQMVTVSTPPSKSGGGGHPAWATTIGNNTSDNNLTWKCFGPAYGVITAKESTGVTWICVGTSTAATWVAGQLYYLPKGGFYAPSSSNHYGGAAVIDTNNNGEFVINTGVSNSTVPSWNATVGGDTTDNSITWFNNGPQSSNSLIWTKGHVYAYSFKARSLDDFYSVASGDPAALPIPPGLSQALPVPIGSETNAISTASPVFTIVGANAGAVNTVSGFGSTDPQVDTIVIWRDADGGGSANMFELTEIPAPPPVGGVAQPWTFQDFLPDTPTSIFPGLNELISAPIDDSNDPPASTFLPMVYNFQRIWGAVGQSVFFSGGPDVVTGNPNEAFNPADELPFLSNVVRLVKNVQGLVTFLTNSVEIIAGGPLTASFFSVTLCPNVGLLSYNFLDVHAGEIYFFSADNQFYAISPSLNLSRAGFPIGDQLANLPSSGVSDTIWNAATGYLAVHQNGIDNCIILADGSTGWYRVNPYQTPGGAEGVEPVWSPFASITGGCKMVQSVETALGIKKLLVGATIGGHQILYRDLTNFTDNGTQYDAYFTMGSIMLVSPGQLAILKFLEMDYSGHSFRPTVSFLLNEISGTFISFTTSPQADPPSIYGMTGVPGSYSPNRYYFSGTKSLARCRHMQIKVDFGKTSAGDELFNLTIFGRLMSEF